MNNKRYHILAGIYLGFLFCFTKGLVLMFLVILIAGYLLNRFLPEEDKSFLIKLFIAGISLRVILLSVFYVYSITHGGNGDFTPDSRFYFLKSLYLLRSSQGYIQSNELLLQIDPGDRRWISGYNYLLTTFYSLSGYRPGMANPVSLFSDKLINCLVGTITAVPIYYIAKDIFGKNIAKISSFLVVFYPSLVLWSMTNIREPFNICLVSLAVFSFNRCLSRKKLRYFIFFCIWLLLLFTIRPYIFFLTLIAVAVASAGILFNFFKNKLFILVIVFIAALLLFNFTSSGINLKRQYLSLDSIIQKVYHANESIIAQQGSNYKIYRIGLPDLKSGRLVELVKGATLGIILFLLVPLPWKISTYAQLVTLPQIMVWYFLIPFVFAGGLFALRYKLKESFLVLSYLLIVTVSFGSIEGNIGSALRHRDLLLPFYFILAAVGFMNLFLGGMRTEKS